MRKISFGGILTLSVFWLTWVAQPHAAQAPVTNDLPPTVRIELSNGDRLTGRIIARSFELVTASAKVNINPGELVRLDRAKDGLVTVNLFNGQTNSGKLTSEDLLVQLEIGPQLSIPPGNIVTICRHGDGPQSPLAAASLGQTTNLQNLLWVPPGEFIMGSPLEEAGRDPDEGPQTRVIIPKGFWIGKYEVTQAEYQTVMGNNPSSLTDDPSRPVDRVSWFEAVEYSKKLTQLAEAAGGLPRGYSFRLPTEAEWEYACRAGSTGRFCYGDDKNETQLVDYAWFSRNGESATHPVGLKKPNAWGVHDMHGNVWEWCLDRWEGALPGGTVTNAPAFSQGTLRVTRGGSWLYDAKSCRSANRDDYAPANRCSDIGFRVVLAPLD